MKTIHNNKQSNDGIINILFFSLFYRIYSYARIFLFSFTFYTKLITFQISLVSLHFTVQQLSWLPDHSWKFNTKQSLLTLQSNLTNVSLLTCSHPGHLRPDPKNSILMTCSIRVSDWVLLGYEFSCANNNQSETIHGPLRHQYGMFKSISRG